MTQLGNERTCVSSSVDDGSLDRRDANCQRSLKPALLSFQPRHPLWVVNLLDFAGEIGNVEIFRRLATLLLVVVGYC